MMSLDFNQNQGENEKMISVTRLDGKTYWLNPHMIESVEQTPDLTITLLSGKKIVVRDTPDEIIERIVSYRSRLGIRKQEI